VGKAGQTLDRIIARAGLIRDDFTIANTVWCRPPDNELVGAWYEDEAIRHCGIHLDEVIARVKPRVIVPLGGTAMRRLIPNIPVGIVEARGYVEWSERYQCWILPTVHPSFIMRGKTAWAQVISHDLQRSVEIADAGYEPAVVNYTLDPTPELAMEWADEFEEYYRVHPDLYLSTDIETPEKDADEEGLDLEDGVDYVILRCGYSDRRGRAISLPWGGCYQAVHERLLGSPAQKLFWNGSYDIPRLLSTGVVINGTTHDGMDAWHVLNSDLKKSLGFVTPFFYHGFPRWKDTSNEQPAWYNAADCDTAGVNMRGTVELLKRHGMWAVYKEYVEELDPVFSAMTRAGMPVDISLRKASSLALMERRDKTRAAIDSLIPMEVKNVSPKNGYVKAPIDTTGLVEVCFGGIKVVRCSVCAAEKPTKAHFKIRTRTVCSKCGSRPTNKHIAACGGTPTVQETNPCVMGTANETVEGTTRWAKVLPFIPSRDGILRYMTHKGHKPIMDGKGKDRKVTTNEKAIRRLIGYYPQEQLYPLVLEDREYGKLLSTYIGEWVEDQTCQS
jgi:uracil-DNA glycosylase family 4